MGKVPSPEGGVFLSAAAGRQEQDGQRQKAGWDQDPFLHASSSRQSPSRASSPWVFSTFFALMFFTSAVNRTKLNRQTTRA